MGLEFYLGQNIPATIFGIVTAILGFSTYKTNRDKKALQDEITSLKTKLHKVTSKVDPESDRQLLDQAKRSVQIMGINALGPIHHCREEIIEMLQKKKGRVQILLLDPRCEAFTNREIKENDRSKRLLGEWKASIGILHDIKQCTKTSFEIRLRKDMPDRSLFIIDGIDANSADCRMLINYYPNCSGTRGYVGAQYLADHSLERDRDSIYKNIDYFYACWDAANEVDIEDAIRIL